MPTLEKGSQNTFSRGEGEFPPSDGARAAAPARRGVGTGAAVLRAPRSGVSRQSRRHCLPELGGSAPTTPRPHKRLRDSPAQLLLSRPAPPRSPSWPETRPCIDLFFSNCFFTSVGELSYDLHCPERASLLGVRSPSAHGVTLHLVRQVDIGPQVKEQPHDFLMATQGRLDKARPSLLPKELGG